MPLFGILFSKDGCIIIIFFIKLSWAKKFSQFALLSENVNDQIVKKADV